MIQTVSIIGAGNVANFLGKRFLEAGITIHQVYARNLSKANQLATVLSAQGVDVISLLDNQADLYVIAVSDNAISSVAEQLVLENTKIVVHTSGGTSKDILQEVTKYYGVFYPFQTITESLTTNLEEVPLLINASNNLTLSTLEKLGKKISTTVQYLADEKRAAVHLAATFTNNFTNHLFTLAQEVISKEQIDWSLMQPLIQQTFNNIYLHSPQQIQTGPARRGDRNILKQHLNYLEQNYPELKNIYQSLSESILNYYGEGTT